MKEKIIFIDPKLERFRELFMESFEEKIDEIIASKNLESFKLKIHAIENSKGGPYLINESGYNCEVLINFHLIPSETEFKNLVTQVLNLIK